MRSPRRIWVVVHRCAGLYMALVLGVAGLTGVVLAFHQTVDRWLGADPVHPPHHDGSPIDPFALRERALALEPRARINFVTLNSPPDEAAYFGFDPRTDPATGRPFDLGAEGLFLDPFTGGLLGHQQPEHLWPVTRKNFTQVVFALHMSLACGDTGRRAFGIGAILWLADAFVGVYLTFPVSRGRRTAGRPPLKAALRWLSRWRTAWRVALGRSFWRTMFDLHRAGGLWAWPLLFSFAASSIAFNLPETYHPVMRHLFGERNPLADLPPLPQPLLDPPIDFRAAASRGQALARQEAGRLEFRLRDGYGHLFLMYDAARGVYSIPVHSDHDVGFHYVGFSVLVDGRTGALRGTVVQNGGDLATTFTTWVCAIHTATFEGRLIHLLVALAGLLTVTLSATGVWVWWKKRGFRKGTRRSPAAPTTANHH